jgi:hypothetical protein
MEVDADAPPGLAAVEIEAAAVPEGVGVVGEVAIFTEFGLVLL